MDKYEFNIKVEQMKKLTDKEDYETAMKIADAIDWKKVKNASLLSMVGTIYEKNHEYQAAKDILLMAYERAPIGKRLLYKLADLALKDEDMEEAEAYYREFCDLAGDDPRQHFLRYRILKQLGAPLEQQIHSLERYVADELDEKQLYELAELYQQQGDEEKCIATCDKLMLMFGLGKYVDKAMELKLQYAPLTKYQMDLVENRDKYEEKLRVVEQSYEEALEEPEKAPVEDGDSDMGKTRVLPEIKRTPASQKVVDEEDEEEEALPKLTNHLMIEARTPEKGLNLAIETLKQIQKETGVKNPVAKITGSKMNKKGVLASRETLNGKDLLIEEAGDLSAKMLKELETLMIQDTTGMRIILIDNPKQMEMLHQQNPTLADKFECIGCEPSEQSGASVSVDKPVAKPVPVAEPAQEPTPDPTPAPVSESVPSMPEIDEEELDIDQFAQYACKYASEIDCSITGKSMLALYERIEIMEEDGIPLTKKNAEALIEEAADRAEKPSVGRAIKDLFSSKYDKDGLLILKEGHFI